MRDQNFKKLVKFFADGRTVCNCGQAYLTNCGVGYIGFAKVMDIPTCAGGCSSAQISAKYEIADRSVTLLGQRVVLPS